MTRILCSLIVVSFLLVPAAWASSGVVTGKNVAVYEQPDGKSEVLVRLKKGKQVSVLAEKGGWAQVKVSLQKGFTFTGWTDKRLLKYKALPAAAKPRAVKARTRNQPLPPARPPVQQPAVQLMPASPPATLQPAPLEPVPSRPITELVGSKRQESAVMGGEEGGFGGISDRLSVTVGAGYSIFGYRLDTQGAAPAKLFSYNLGGFAFHVNAKYWIWQSSSGLMRAGTDVRYQYGMYNLTKLTVTTGTGTDPLSAKSDNTSHDITFKVPFEYRFKPERVTSKVGLYAGFEYLNFSAKDATDTAGNPINLFVGQTTSSILGGAYGTFVIPGTAFGVTVGSDVLFLNYTKEKPADATGTGPKAKLGFTPFVAANWHFAEQHDLEVGYKLRWQDFTFNGTGARIIAGNVTDGKVQNRIHDITVSYSYLF